MQQVGLSEPSTYTEREAASILNIRVSTLRKWRLHKVRGPRWIRIGRCVRYPAEPLALYLATRPGGGEGSHSNQGCDAEGGQPRASVQPIR